MSDQRTLPLSDLDLQMMLTEPDWGKEINDTLKKKLSSTWIVEAKDQEGNITSVSYKDVAWGVLSFYKKEMRLANLNKEQLIYCQEYIDFAGDVLEYELKKSFMIALRRAITILELSQSREGFLRKRFGTVTSEQKNELIDPERKKGFFGEKKKPEV